MGASHNYAYRAERVDASCGSRPRRGSPCHLADEVVR